MSINLEKNGKKVESILLAAGQSSRMGSDKALLEIDGEISICRIIRKLLSFSGKTIIVLGSNFRQVSEAVKNLCPSKNRIEFVFNECHLEGMFSSVIKGFEAVSENVPVLLQMIDQPFVPARIYQELLTQLDEKNLIFQPIGKKNGKIRPAHPILFAAEFKEIINHNQKAETLAELIHFYEDRRKFFRTEKEEIFQNLNTPEDLKKIKDKKWKHR